MASPGEGEPVNLKGRGSCPVSLLTNEKALVRCETPSPWVEPLLPPLSSYTRKQNHERRVILEGLGKRRAEFKEKGNRLIQTNQESLLERVTPGVPQKPDWDRGSTW